MPPSLAPRWAASWSLGHGYFHCCDRMAAQHPSPGTVPAWEARGCGGRSDLFLILPEAGSGSQLQTKTWALGLWCRRPGQLPRSQRPRPREREPVSACLGPGDAPGMQKEGPGHRCLLRWGVPCTAGPGLGKRSLRVGRFPP